MIWCKENIMDLKIPSRIHGTCPKCKHRDYIFLCITAGKIEFSVKSPVNALSITCIICIIKRKRNCRCGWGANNYTFKIVDGTGSCWQGYSHCTNCNAASYYFKYPGIITPGTNDRTRFLEKLLKVRLGI